MLEPERINGNSNKKIYNISDIIFIASDIIYSNSDILEFDINRIFMALGIILSFLSFMTLISGNILF